MASAAFRILFARRVHRTPHRFRERLLTGANVLTIARAIGTSAVMLVAIVEQSHALLLAGLLASWILDIADGQIARWRGHESVLGAQLDILADRATAMWVVLGVVVFDQAAPLAVCAGAAVWVQLSFFDQLLAGQFLRFGHWSPDEFHLEDPAVWRLNWAPAAKALGNLPLALLALGGSLLWAALALALGLAGVRIASYLRIQQRAGIEGSYDDALDEVRFRLDGCGAPDEAAADCLLDGDGRIVELRYGEARRRLPDDLLAFLASRHRADAPERDSGGGTGRQLRPPHPAPEPPPVERVPNAAEADTPLRAA